MKSFKLYMIDKTDSPILLSDYEVDRTINQMMTYDENLSEQEHDRYDFSFNIVDKPFPTLPASFFLAAELRVGRELRLYLDGNEIGDEYIAFIIIGVTPQLNKENNTYSVNCQDYASYIWSKNNTGLSFDSLTDEEYNDTLGLSSNLLNMANYILSRGNLTKPITTTVGTTPPTGTELNWVNPLKGYTQNIILSSGTPSLNNINNKLWRSGGSVLADSTFTGQTIVGNHDFPFTYPATTGLYFYTSNSYLKFDSSITNLDFDIRYEVSEIIMNTDDWEVVILTDYNSNYNLLLENFNIAVSDSNTYNALVELATISDSLIKINYETKKINFISKDNSSYFNKSYQLSPEYNLQDVSIDINTENFAPLLFVSGAEDEYELSVGIVPTIPASALPYLLAGRGSSRIFYGEVTFDGTLNRMTIAEGTLTGIDVGDSITISGSVSNNVTHVVSSFDGTTIVVGATITTEAAVNCSMSAEGIITNYNKSSYYTDWYNETSGWIEKAIDAGETESTSIFLEIADKIPYLDSFLFNIEYFSNSGLLDSSNTIFGDIYNTLRKINYRFQNAIKRKYELKSLIYLQEEKIKSLSELVMNEDADKFAINYQNLRDEFYVSHEGTTYTINAFNRSSVPTGDGDVPTWEPTTSGSTYCIVNEVGTPATIITLNSSGYNFTGTGSESAPNIGDTQIQANKTYTALSDLWAKTFILEEWQAVSDDVWEWQSVQYGFKDLQVNNYSQLSEPGNTAAENQGVFAYVTNTDNHYLSVLVTAATYDWVGTLPLYQFKTINFNEESEGSQSFPEYPWFDKLRTYAGDELVEEKYTYYRELIIEYIQERVDAEEKIAQLTDSLALLTVGTDEYNSTEVEIASYEERVRILESGVGTWTYDGSVFTKIDFGKYTMLFQVLDEYKTLYDASGTGGTVPPADPDKTTRALYQEVYNEKQDFWYTLKSSYGKFLTEGYYENNIESDPLQLYNESVLYALGYKAPQESFGATVIDISSLIGINVEAVKVGDIVNIKIPTSHYLNSGTIVLQINAISKEMRSSSNISLTLEKYNDAEKLLEQLLLGILNK